WSEVSAINTLKKRDYKGSPDHGCSKSKNKFSDIEFLLVSKCCSPAEDQNNGMYPFISKSGYFKKALHTSAEIELPENFPGGPKVFKMVVLFTYGSSTLIDPFNVALLRCAAEFLEMNEDYGLGNLCERSDLYLNQVVLQSWDDTLIVLQKCHTLLPLSEELLIVSHCFESLAFMACLEILDLERRRETLIITLEHLASRAWSCETVKEVSSQDLWIKDLIALPFGTLRR
ncbi:hypothetical protein GIB67_039415, partial [Kingdonia uniflora]